MTISSAVGRLAIVALLLVVSAGGVAAQPPTTAGPDAGIGNVFKNDSDPTRPVLFSIRPEIYSPRSDVTQTALIFRYDRAQLRARRWLPGKRGVITRMELPVATTAVPGATQAGLGDAYAQLLVSPYFTRRFAFLVGSGLRIPTATDNLLGTGKWVVAPAVAPVWFLQNTGMFFVKVQNLSSIAGAADRQDINFLLVTPTFIHTAHKNWWFLVDAETRTDWQRDQATAIRGGLQVGHAFGSRFSTWVKPEVGWDPNLDIQWNLKFGLVWFR